MGRKTFLDRFPHEPVTLRKKTGGSFEFRALVQSDLITADEAALPVQEGDIIERTVGSGMIEKYLVLDRGFLKGMHGVPDHYQMKVGKITTATSESKAKIQQASTHIYNLTGANARVNIQSEDGSINISSVTNDELFAVIGSAINRHVPSETQRSEMIEKLNALKIAKTRLRLAKGTGNS